MRTLSEIKRKNLEDEHESLLKEYNALSAQYRGELDDGKKSRIDESRSNLERKINKLENELAVLSNPSAILDATSAVPTEHIDEYRHTDPNTSVDAKLPSVISSYPVSYPTNVGTLEHQTLGPPVWSSDQRRQLHEAILNAFPRRKDLERLVKMSLTVSLKDITHSTNSEDCTIYIIDWALDHDKIDALLEVARQENPDNLELYAIEKSHTSGTTYLNKSDPLRIRLTRDQHINLHKMLLICFPKNDSIEQFLVSNFGVQLSVITDNIALDGVMLNVIRWIESRDKVEELLSLLVRLLPENIPLEFLLYQVNLTSLLASRIRLTGKERDILHQSLLSAFPSYKTLDLMLFFGMDRRLDQITEGTNLSRIVFSLIMWCEQYGKVGELLWAGFDRNPENHLLKDVVVYHVRNIQMLRKLNMLLNSEQRVTLIQAFLSAFPILSDLEQMLLTHLNQTLPHKFNRMGQLSAEQVSELLIWAEENSSVMELIQAAVEANPRNYDLRLIASTLNINCDKSGNLLPSISPPLKLNEKELDQLHGILHNAFPDGALQRLVRLYLGENLSVIAGETELEEQVASLIQWAMAYNRLEELITAACEAVVSAQKRGVRPELI